MFKMWAHTWSAHDTALERARRVPIVAYGVGHEVTSKSTSRDHRSLAAVRQYDADCCVHDQSTLAKGSLDGYYLSLASTKREAAEHGNCV